MSARQLIVLAIAAVAAIGAMLIFRGMGGAVRPTAAAAADIQGVRVLVATKNIAAGGALTADALQWRVFPEDSLNQNFIKETERPDAPTDMAGWVTRRAYIAGEPITNGSVIDPQSRGFMAAMLRPGFRAVSVKIDTATNAGDFIQPNDHVDVILTVEIDVRSARGGSDKEVRTSVIMENVRVLAVGENVSPQTSGEQPERATGDVAVLELSANDARIMAQAETLGKIRLALRGVEIEQPGLRVESNVARGAAAMDQNVQQGGVRVHAYGAVSERGGM